MFYKMISTRVQEKLKSKVYDDMIFSHINSDIFNLVAMSILPLEKANAQNSLIAAIRDEEF